MSHAAAYDAVAELYDRAFSDIRVREVELAWLGSALERAAPRPRLLELGCGTGAVLRALAPRIAEGTGVDVSEGMLARARRHTADVGHLRYVRLDSPALPFADASFDVVISFLSFRYLDWNAAWPELRRVLAPGGRFLMVDLVRASAGLGDVPKLARSSLRHVLAKRRRPGFARDLCALTAHPDWAAMLRRHPMRGLPEYRAFFAERLPTARFRDLDVLPRRRVVALDSGPLS